jgi:nitrogen PTS system EIIA component
VGISGPAGTTTGMRDGQYCSREESMRLSTRDVSEAFSVTEATLTRWIKQRGLPAQYVAGRYRFHRAELLEWATANGVKVRPDLFDRFDDDDEPPPSLAEAIERGGIFYRLRDTNRDLVLGAMVEVLPVPADIDRGMLLRLFLAREAAASTGVGDGIALPHVRNPIILHVSQPMVSLCFLERPVDFGALDGQPVHVLFAVISPTTRGHLQLLSRIAHAIHDKEFKAAILAQSPSETILREARRVDAALADQETGKAAR